MRSLYRRLFWMACVLGRPVGGLRPHRIYHWLAKRGFSQADVRYVWHRDTWGSELLLSPYFFIDRQILAFGCYDRELHRYLEGHVEPGMVCLDVGANLGEVTLHLARKVGPEGRVFAFEPVPRVCERLESHIERNGLSAIVGVCGEALWDAEGVERMRSPPAVAPNQGMASLVDTEHPKLSDDLEVRTTTLDRWMQRHELARLDLIKVDIQGGESRLLRGGHETLERCSPDLLLEIGPHELRYEGMSGSDLIAQVESLGYRVYALRGGERAERLGADSVPRDFAASNVLCTRR